MTTMAKEQELQCRLEGIMQHNSNLISQSIYRHVKAIRPLVYAYCDLSGSDILFDSGFSHALDILERVFKPSPPPNGRY